MAYITQRLFLFITILACGVTYSPQVAFATNNSDIIVVHAVVLPHRYAVLNQENQIQQILSNTPANIAPIFTRGDVNGLHVASTPELLTSYYSIANSLDFSKPGIVYERQRTTSADPLYIAMQFVKQFLVKIS